MRNNITSPVTGNDFYGRERELREAMTLLESNQSILLSAPRRVGKSSLAMKIKRLLDEKGIRNIYVDLEGVETQEDFLKKLLDHFDLSVPVKFDFSDEKKVSDLYYTIAEALDHDKDTVVIVDELTLFLTYREREGGTLNGVKFLLNWLRSLRQVADTKIRWLFSGSIGLHHFTGIRNLTYAINDMAPVELGPLDGREAKEMLAALAQSVGLEMPADVREYLLTKLGWPVPYLIQLMVNRLVVLSDGKTVAPSMVDRAFEELADSKILNIWRERLTEYNGFEQMAEYALTELSKTPEGKTKEELLRQYCTKEGLADNFETEFKFSEAMSLLVDDGYLYREKGKLMFRSPLIREWWNRHYG